MIRFVDAEYVQQGQAESLVGIAATEEPQWSDPFVRADPLVHANLAVSPRRQR